MSRRKDELRNLLTGSPAPETPPVEAAKPESAPRAASGAVKAMGLQLHGLKSGAEDARALRETLRRGDTVVEINPALIEPAFVSDRLSQGAAHDESFEALKASIADGGQEVPVLLRPHPDAAKAASGHYQAAYGHRRIAAARELGRPVRAVVRELTDEALVIAQGKENSERRDLSFIERAMFAHALMRHGLERATVQAALSVHPSELTRLLQVAEAVPEAFVRAIGPAPRVGRPRWLALAERLRGEAAKVKASQEINGERFRQAASDERFQLLFDRLEKRGAKTPPPAVLQGAKGERLGEMKAGARTASLTLPGDFAAFLARALPELHARFIKESEGD